MTHEKIWSLTKSKNCLWIEVHDKSLTCQPTFWQHPVTVRVTTTKKIGRNRKPFSVRLLPFSFALLKTEDIANCKLSVAILAAHSLNYFVTQKTAIL